MYVCAVSRLQEWICYLDAVINPCQVRGYENLWQVCCCYRLSILSHLSSSQIQQLPLHQQHLGRGPAVVLQNIIAWGSFSPSTWIQSPPSPKVEELKDWEQNFSLVVSFKDPCCVIITVAEHIWLSSPFGPHEFNIWTPTGNVWGANGPGK